MGSINSKNKTIVLIGFVIDKETSLSPIPLLHYSQPKCEVSIVSESLLICASVDASNNEDIGYEDWSL